MSDRTFFFTNHSSPVMLIFNLKMEYQIWVRRIYQTGDFIKLHLPQFILIKSCGLMGSQ